MIEHLKVEGIICSDDKEFDNNKFIDDFIEWVESKGLYFGGGFEPLKNKEYK
ncbi:TPA: hypothetical protein LA460_000076 [Clostridium botulinum]|nr:hypothetical protein [Clostridium botulinum]HBJ1652681.1 hypothetical protein [Clostridium botulinum]